MLVRAISGSGGGGGGNGYFEQFTPSSASDTKEFDLSALGISNPTQAMWVTRQNGNTLYMIRWDITANKYYMYRDNNWSEEVTGFESTLYQSGNSIFFKPYDSRFVYPTCVWIV